ncbi:catalase [Irpex rosettiformis]|uniref:Catalase n=1 Tax=Irpex rosettiformis TaxID=378272 RepID=A0ACB8U8S2_9APHY|nr:catalase [Irpex rosettiformis]
MPSPKAVETKDGAVFTASNGAPVAEPYAAHRIGTNGPLLIQDFNLIDSLAHFARERIPERVVHAKAAGAHGYFEATEDISDISCASLFQKGKKTPITARFSTVGGELGSADTARDPRGFAVKLKTDEGNLDWVFNNTPVFFIRDPTKFPHFIHTQKRDPETHLKDADMFWDYLSLNPESVHQVMTLFSDRGTPNGYSHMHGYSGHTFKFVNKEGKFVYVQIHWRIRGGVQTLDNEQAGKLAGDNPDYGIELLRSEIDAGKFPTWDVYVQTMTAEQAEQFRYNILDLTKVWPHSQFPLRHIGTAVLNENPKNYFAEIEQAAFSPSHLVSGIEPSADPVLQSRLFSYPDTHRHRLGVNYQQLPVNRPLVPVANFQRDGFMAFDNQGWRPNYQSSLIPLTYKKKPYEDAKHELWLGHANVDLSFITELDFEQPRALWQKVFDDTQKAHFVHNVAVHIVNVKSAAVKKRQLSVFAAVDQSLSDRIAQAINHPTVKPLEVPPAEKANRFSLAKN